jgi:hypothetical protein
MGVYKLILFQIDITLLLFVRIRIFLHNNFMRG